jgi:phage gp36-like protein
MAYATVAEMIAKFGEAEMIRMSTPSGVDMVAVVNAPVETALQECSDLIDGYLRKRYSVPLAVAPTEIRRACCLLARYDLSIGEQKQASEAAIKDRDDTVAWLKQIALGQVLLDLQEVNTGDDSFATMQERRAVYGDDHGGCGGGWP